MKSGELAVNGLEKNRVLALFEEMSSLDDDALAKSQSVNAGSNFHLMEIMPLQLFLEQE